MTLTARLSVAVVLLIGTSLAHLEPTIIDQQLYQSSSGPLEGVSLYQKTLQKFQLTGDLTDDEWALLIVQA